MITWADVSAIAPDLSTLVVGTQNAILADVALQLNASTLGTRFDLASKYLAAHAGTLAARGALGAGGPVSAETVGPLSRSYAVPSAYIDELDATPFGREYRRIVRMNVARIGILGGC